MTVAIPTGSLTERLQQLAEIHRRNGALCAPEFTGDRAVLEVAKRHALIHEQASADILEAVALIESAALAKARGDQ